MTAAGIALIVGGLAILVGCRHLLWSSSRSRRRRNRKAAAKLAGTAGATRVATADSDSSAAETVTSLGAPARTSPDGPRGDVPRPRAPRRARRRSAATAIGGDSGDVDPEPSGLASLGLADDEDDEPPPTDHDPGEFSPEPAAHVDAGSGAAADLGAGRAADLEATGFELADFEPLGDDTGSQPVVVAAEEQDRAEDFDEAEADSEPAGYAMARSQANFVFGTPHPTLPTAATTRFDVPTGPASTAFRAAGGDPVGRYWTPVDVPADPAVAWTPVDHHPTWRPADDDARWRPAAAEAQWSPEPVETGPGRSLAIDGPQQRPVSAAPAPRAELSRPAAARPAAARPAAARPAAGRPAAAGPGSVPSGAAGPGASRPDAARAGEGAPHGADVGDARFAGRWAGDAPWRPGAAPHSPARRAAIVPEPPEDGRAVRWQPGLPVDEVRWMPEDDMVWRPAPEAHDSGSGYRPATSSPPPGTPVVPPWPPTHPGDQARRRSMFEPSIPPAPSAAPPPPPAPVGPPIPAAVERAAAQDRRDVAGAAAVQDPPRYSPASDRPAYPSPSPDLPAPLPTAPISAAPMSTAPISTAPISAAPISAAPGSTASGPAGSVSTGPRPALAGPAGWADRGSGPAWPAPEEPSGWTPDSTSSWLAAEATSGWVTAAAASAHPDESTGWSAAETTSGWVAGIWAATEPRDPWAAGAVDEEPDPEPHQRSEAFAGDVVPPDPAIHPATVAAAAAIAAALYNRGTAARPAMQGRAAQPNVTPDPERTRSSTPDAATRDLGGAQDFARAQDSGGARGFSTGREAGGADVTAAAGPGTAAYLMDRAGAPADPGDDRTGQHFPRRSRGSAVRRTPGRADAVPAAEPQTRQRINHSRTEARRRTSASTEIFPAVSDATHVLPAVPVVEGYTTFDTGQRDGRADSARPRESDGPPRPRPRPRPRPGAQPGDDRQPARSTVYVSRHAAEPS